jgi:hypothetical protein
MKSIKQTALRFYRNDVNCPITWEPGGTDFLSPCLEEADLMWRILPPAAYEPWLKKFLPSLFSENIPLKPGEVKDRTDGRLVHLDGLNFSRAWCLYGRLPRTYKVTDQKFWSRRTFTWPPLCLTWRVAITWENTGLHHLLFTR